jgi:hypothetical protein
MKTCALACVLMLGAAAVVADEPSLTVDLLPGHPVHDVVGGRAGMVTPIAITEKTATTTDLEALCETLRVAAGLSLEAGHGRLTLQVVFIVPYKLMAIEGYYLPLDGKSGSSRLIAGNSIARERLDGIIVRAGVPPGILDETEVEHEVSCELDRPAWRIRWEDVRTIAGDDPEAVIERAYTRFLAIHRTVVEQAAHLPKLAKM